METDTNGKRITLFGKGSPLVILNTVHGEGESVYKAVKDITDKPFTLASISRIRWNDEMTPWPSPPVASWDSPYAGLADGYISDLENTIIPAIVEKMEMKPEYIAIAGYSLGGLFAIYSLFRTNIFRRAVSASGSLWYPGFTEFAAENELKATTDRIYLSLGDAESKKGSAIMRSVGEKTEQLLSVLKEKGCNTFFESNPGGHFKDADLRMAKGIRWIIS